MRTRGKKFLALLCAAVLALAMCLPAMAADTTTPATVSISGTSDYALNGQTVYLFQLFKLTGDEGEAGYTVNKTYEEALKTTLKDMQQRHAATDSSFALYTDSDTIYRGLQNLGSKYENLTQEFSAEVMSQLINAGVSADYKQTANGSTLTFSGVTPGYYLVYGTGGESSETALASIQPGANAKIEIKSKLPKIDKKVSVNGTEAKDAASVTVGDTLTYTVTGTVPLIIGYTDPVYKLTDTLSSGLEYTDGSVNVTLTNPNTKEVTALKSTDYTVSSEKADDKTTLVVDLSSYIADSVQNGGWITYPEGGGIGQTITVSYKAKVTTDATTATGNTVRLNYSNTPADTTGKGKIVDNVKTPTYTFYVNKIDDNGKALAGATFSLYTKLSEDEKSGDASSKILLSGADGVYTVNPSAEDSSTMVNVEKIGGNKYNLSISGLAAGTYYLIEDKAPGGYNKLNRPVTVILTDVGDLQTAAADQYKVYKSTTDDANEESDRIIDVVNTNGTNLPVTGGRGTVILTCAALVAAFGVAVSFVRSRKHE